MLSLKPKPLSVKAEAEARAEQLNDIELSLVSKAGDEGKLFGSIGPRDLADAISFLLASKLPRAKYVCRKVRFAKLANTTSLYTCMQK